MRQLILTVLLGTILCAGANARAADQPDSSGIAVTGVCGVSPVLDTSCLAVEVPLATDEAVTGFRWYNNDGTAVFPSVVLLAGEPGASPVLADSSLVLHGVQGLSSGWAEVTLAYPVGVTQGSLVVVFMLPSNQPRTGIGAGSGPGFGLSDRPSGVSTQISLDGDVWTGATCQLAFEALKVPYAQGMPRLGSGSGGQLAKRAASVPLEPTGLLGAKPNPFNPSTTIAYNLSRPGPVNLSVYNLRGQRVVTLVDEDRPGGPGQCEWRGLDAQGRSVPSGVYVVRMRAAGEVFTQRLGLVR